MKSGAINVITKSGQGLSLDSVPLERREEGMSLSSTIELNPTQAPIDEFSDESGSVLTIQEGSVFRENPVEIKTRRIDEEGNLVVEDESTERQVAETRFAYVEGELFVTERTEAEDARRIAESLSSSRIREARIDVRSFAEDHPEADPFLEWASDEEGDSKICVVGEDREWDEVIDDLDTSSSAQISFDNLRWDEKRLHMTVTRSGYVEIYSDKSGGRVGTRDFVRFLLDEVAKHTYLDNQEQVYA